MKPVVTRLYAVLVVLALVGLIAWSGADWYQRQGLAERHVQTVLRQAAGQISELSIRNQGLSASSLAALFSRATGNDARWKMVLLASPEQGTEYYKGPRPAVSVERAVPMWQARPLQEIKVSLPVFRTQGTMTIEAIYEFYGRNEIFQLLRAAGLTLVVLVVLTSAVVFLASRRRDEDEQPSEARLVEDDPLPDLDEPLLETESAPSSDADEYWFDESLTLDDLPPLEEPSEDHPVEASSESDLTFEEVESPSLFSPQTTLGWQSFLETRLEHELQRCAAQNLDLALVLFAIKEGEVAPEEWGRAIREAFPSVDLDFEYEGGAAVVLPGETLEQALRAARAFIETSDRGGITVHAGVASRTGRLISAQTLLGEAASARRRSLAGTVRALGLKTDPERYREHLSQHPRPADHL